MKDDTEVQLHVCKKASKAHLHKLLGTTWHMALNVLLYYDNCKQTINVNMQVEFWAYILIYYFFAVFFFMIIELSLYILFGVS